MLGHFAACFGICDKPYPKMVTRRWLLKRAPLWIAAPAILSKRSNATTGPIDLSTVRGLHTKWKTYPPRLLPAYTNGNEDTRATIQPDLYGMPPPRWFTVIKNTGANLLLLNLDPVGRIATPGQSINSSDWTRYKKAILYHKD